MSQRLSVPSVVGGPRVASRAEMSQRQNVPTPAVCSRVSYGAGRNQRLTLPSATSSSDSAGRNQRLPLPTTTTQYTNSPGINHRLSLPLNSQTTSSAGRNQRLPLPSDTEITGYSNSAGRNQRLPLPSDTEITGYSNSAERNPCRNIPVSAKIASAVLNGHEVSNRLGLPPAEEGRKVSYVGDSSIIRVDHHKYPKITPPRANLQCVETLVFGFKPKGPTTFRKLQDKPVANVDRNDIYSCVVYFRNREQAKPAGEGTQIAPNSGPMAPNRTETEPATATSWQPATAVRPLSPISEASNFEDELPVTPPPQKKRRGRRRKAPAKKPKPKKVDPLALAIIPDKAPKKPGRKPKSQSEVLAIEPPPARAKRFQMDPLLENMYKRMDKAAVAQQRLPMVQLSLECPRRLPVIPPEVLAMGIAEKIKLSPRIRRQSLQGMESCATKLRMKEQVVTKRAEKRKLAAITWPENAAEKWEEPNNNNAVALIPENNNVDYLSDESSERYTPNCRRKAKYKSPPFFSEFAFKPAGSAEKRKLGRPRKKSIENQDPEAVLLRNAFKQQVYVDPPTRQVIALPPKKREFLKLSPSVATVSKETDKALVKFSPQPCTLGIGSVTASIERDNNACSSLCAAVNCETDSCSSLSTDKCDFLENSQKDVPASRVNQIAVTSVSTIPNDCRALVCVDNKHEEESLHRARLYKPTRRLKSFEMEIAAKTDEDKNEAAGADVTDGALSQRIARGQFLKSPSTGYLPQVVLRAEDRCDPNLQHVNLVRKNLTEEFSTDETDSSDSLRIAAPLPVPNPCISNSKDKNKPYVPSRYHDLNNLPFNEIDQIHEFDVTLTENDQNSLNNRHPVETQEFTNKLQVSVTEHDQNHFNRQLPIEMQKGVNSHGIIENVVKVDDMSFCNELQWKDSLDVEPVRLKISLDLRPQQIFKVDKKSLGKQTRFEKESRDPALTEEDPLIMRLKRLENEAPSPSPPTPPTPPNTPPEDAIHSQNLPRYQLPQEYADHVIDLEPILPTVKKPERSTFNETAETEKCSEVNLEANNNSNNNNNNNNSNNNNNNNSISKKKTKDDRRSQSLSPKKLAHSHTKRPSDEKPKSKSEEKSPKKVEVKRKRQEEVSEPRAKKTKEHSDSRKCVVIKKTVIPSKPNFQRSALTNLPQTDSGRIVQLVDMFGNIPAKNKRKKEPKRPIRVVPSIFGPPSESVVSSMKK